MLPAAAAQRGSIGLYVHIPFCQSKCPYCDFYSVSGSPAKLDAYTEAVCRSFRQLPAPIPHGADTLYFGGGTPSLAGAGRLSRILECAQRYAGLFSDAEITLEANPGSLNAADLSSLHSAGFNRISFGVQSLRDSELQALGRTHTAAQAQEAVLAAHDAGFRHISVDLMLGIPGQNRLNFGQTLSALSALPVDHVSAYLLKLEPGTPMHSAAPKLSLPDEDETARLYLDCVSALEAMGFRQYEVSNFAQKGGESRHNLKYWRCESYLGFGPSAHSYQGGKRFYQPSDLERFLKAENAWSLTVPDGEGGSFDEYAMLRLRLAEGLSLKEAEHFGADATTLRRRAQSLERQGLLHIDDGHIALTPQGFLLQNAVTAALLS